jgi:hypothetical protein
MSNSVKGMRVVREMSLSIVFLLLTCGALSAQSSMDGRGEEIDEWESLMEGSHE